jgi:hypothetical protein
MPRECLEAVGLLAASAAAALLTRLSSLFFFFGGGGERHKGGNRCGRTIKRVLAAASVFVVPIFTLLFLFNTAKYHFLHLSNTFLGKIYFYFDILLFNMESLIITAGTLTYFLRGMTEVDERASA